MVDYEKGTPSWDISQILTRHANHASGADRSCEKVASLIRTRGRPAHERLQAAHEAPCDCGAGDSISEHTTERKAAQNASRHTTDPARR
jgi:hypothetical protein